MADYQAVDGGSKETQRSRCTCCRCCVITWVVIIATIAVALVVTALTFPYPLHASCTVNWQWAEPCSKVNSMLKDQMGKWSGDDCGTGQKCLYQVTFNSSGTLKGTHTTPVKRYIDDLTFTFSTRNSTNSTSTYCAVQGYSTSRVWYAFLDFGTNYCNLHNLVNGSSLYASPGYKESTKDAVCTQYSSRNCEKY